MFRLGALMPAVALLAGCSPELITIDLSDRDAVVVFLAVLDEQGAPVRFAAPFVMEEGRVLYGGARPQVELGDGEDDVVVVEIGVEDLARANPGLIEERAVEVRKQEPPATPQRFALEGRFFRVEQALPEQARVFDVVEGRPRASERAAVRELLFGSTTLEVIVDPEHCRRSAGPTLTPYGPTQEIIVGLSESDLESTRGQFQGVARIDQDRLLVSTGSHLYIVHRDQSFRPPATSTQATSNHWPASTLPGTATVAVGISDIAMDRSVPSSGPHVAWVAGTERVEERVGDDRYRALAWRISIGAEGFTSAETATVVALAEPGSAWSDGVGVDGAGRVAVSITSNKTVEEAFEFAVLIREPGSERFERIVFAQDPLGLDEVARVHWTGNRAYPLAVGMRSAVAVFREDLTRVDVTDLGSPTEESIHFAAIASERPPREWVLWAGGDKGSLFRRTPAGDFRLADLVMPSRYSACSGNLQPGELPELVSGLSEARITDDRAYLLLDQCSALLDVRLEDDCVSLLTPDDADPVRLARKLRYESMDYADGELVVVGRRGTVLTAPVGP